MNLLIKYKAIILVLVVSSIVYVLHTAWAIYIFSNKSKSVKADAAIVLGAAVWGNKPSPVFRERINYAILLCRDGYVKKIVFTGGKGGE